MEGRGGGAPLTVSEVIPFGIAISNVRMTDAAATVQLTSDAETPAIVATVDCSVVVSA